LLQLTAQLAALLHQAARQQQLQIQATRLHDLARASGDWLWELDADLRYRWIAGDYAVITGQDPALLLGTVPAPELRVDAQGQALSEGGNLLDLLAQRQPFSRAISLAQTALGPRYVSRSAVPVLTAEGLFAGYRGTARDLTPGIDSARQALRQGAENEALRRDKAQAEHRDQAKSALLSRVSHELRTPMNAVLGFSQLMVNDPLDPLPAAQAARLQGIRTAGGRLLTVIDDLLELVNIGPGSVVCSAGAPGLDLGAALHRQRLAWQTRQGVTGEPFQAVLAQDLSVVAEAPALDRILHHVLNDAFTHGRPGADVQVKARADGDDVVLEVCHETSVSGPLDLGRLFEPFGFTGLSERAARGSGLDLVIARDLARQGGGQLTASQLAGAPLCLALRLPRGAPAHAAAGAGRRASLRQVLYVEDEPLNVVLMEEIFRGRPEWQLHVARTGSDGVALAREVLPDLALIDMNLPDFNGLEVLRRLRADAGTQHIPCVALSADAMVEQIAAARAAGFDDYWTKPIDLLRLLGAVEQVLAGKT
jgi:CheY-like chemotaxis protein/signal transduction histidine kinase